VKGQDGTVAGDGWMLYLTAIVTICTVVFIALALGFRFKLVSQPPLIAVGAGGLGAGVGILLTRMSMLAIQPKRREVTFLRLGLGSLALAIVLMLSGVFTPFTPRLLSSGSSPLPTTPGVTAAPTPSPARSSTASPSAAGSPNPSVASAGPTASPPAVRFRGSVTLTSGGSGAGLDGLPNSSGPPYDLLLSDGGTQMAGQGFSSLALWTDARPPSADDCAKQVATQGRSTVPAGLGTQLCVRTAAGRWAYLKVTGRDSQTVLLDVEVWEKTA
jgi:hypothetical protein